MLITAHVGYVVYDPATKSDCLWLILNIGL